MTQVIVNSADSLGDLLGYVPETGRLFWKVARGRQPSGAMAGYDTGRGYVGVRVNKRCMYAHRVAFLLMTGSCPEFIDHINGVRSDNRWSNLRAVTRSENGMNMRTPKTNRSGVIGVFWNEGKGKWTARLKVRQVTHHIGHFDDLEEAIAARRDAEKKHGFHANHGRAV